MLDIATHSHIINQLTAVIGRVQLAQRRLNSDAMFTMPLVCVSQALHDLEEAELAAWNTVEAVNGLIAVDLGDKPKEVAYQQKGV